MAGLVMAGAMSASMKGHEDVAVNACVIPGDAGPNYHKAKFSATQTLWVKQYSLVAAGSCLQPWCKESCSSVTALSHWQDLPGCSAHLGSSLSPEGFCLVKTWPLAYTVGKHHPLMLLHREHVTHPGCAWCLAAMFPFMEEKGNNFALPARELGLQISCISSLPCTASSVSQL